MNAKLKAVKVDLSSTFLGVLLLTLVRRRIFKHSNFKHSPMLPQTSFTTKTRCSAARIITVLLP